MTNTQGERNIMQLGMAQLIRYKHLIAIAITYIACHGSLLAEDLSPLNELDGFHYADISQRGDLNTLSLSQKGSRYSNTIVSQGGSLNTLTLSQTGGDYNHAVILQDGSLNTLTVEQNGSDNLLDVTQSMGANNLIHVNQFGISNSAGSKW